MGVLFFIVFKSMGIQKNWQSDLWAGENEMCVVLNLLMCYISGNEELLRVVICTELKMERNAVP